MIRAMLSDAERYYCLGEGIQKAVELSFVGASWQISLTEVSESFDKVETLPFSPFKSGPGEHSQQGQTGDRR